MVPEPERTAHGCLHWFNKLFGSVIHVQNEQIREGSSPDQSATGTVLRSTTREIFGSGRGDAVQRRARERNHYPQSSEHQLHWWTTDHREIDNEDQRDSPSSFTNNHFCEPTILDSIQGFRYWRLHLLYRVQKYYFRHWIQTSVNSIRRSILS